MEAVRFQHPQIDNQRLSGNKAYGTPDYLACLFSQGIIPSVSLRDYDLEELPTWKRESNKPEWQRKRQEKVDKVATKNKAKEIQLEGKYRDIQEKRVQCEHVFA